MGASAKMKDVLKKEGLSQKQFAEILYGDMNEEVNGYAQVRNTLTRDQFKYETIEKWLDALGYEIVFKKKKRRRS